MSEQTTVPPKSRDEHIKDYVKEICKIDADIKKLQELKKDFKGVYKDNKWLTADDLKLATKAISLLKQEVDMEELNEIIEAAAKVF